MIAAAVVALIVIIAAASVGRTGSDDVASGSGEGGPGVSAPSSDASSDEPPTTESDSADTASDPGEDPYDAGTEPSSTPTASDAAYAQLEELADDGLAQVSLDGQDVAMIASKWNGVTDPLQETESGSHTFGYVDILAEHERLASQDNLGAQIVLLRGTDYGKRRSSPAGTTIYVTFALESFSTLGEVDDWCAERFAGLSKAERADSCVPTKLTS